MQGYQRKTNRGNPRYPMFMGEPSPALMKIQRMSTGELTQYVERLSTEIDHVRNKLDALRDDDSTVNARVTSLESLLTRLEALRVEANRRLDRTTGYESK